ncbi:MAG: amidohydrolase family protein [Candidatus Brocadiia bacterium]
MKNDITRIDCHNHCVSESGRWPCVDIVVANARKMGIESTCCSHPITTEAPSPEGFRKGNDDILACMERYPDEILGQCFVNPGYGQEALDEIDRCVVGGGMVGVKLYHQYRIDEPVQYPVIEKCIELGVPILMHAGHSAVSGGMPGQPRLSGGEHFAEVARRYPEAMLICAHIGGGGDWEWQIKALREADSVYLDTSGSVIDAGMIERCVRDLGADRLLFATDMNLGRGMGKLVEADIDEEEREEIFGQNFEQILEKRNV